MKAGPADHQDQGRQAEGNAIKISAEAEKEAARLRGQGSRCSGKKWPRDERGGRTDETGQPGHQCHLFSMWTEAIKNFAEVVRQYYFPGWQQRGHAEYHAADPGPDDEAAGKYSFRRQATSFKFHT